MSRWEDWANCKDVDPHLYFGHENEDHATRKARIKTAKAICDKCVVRSECASFASSENISYGIWGGLSEKERNRGDIELGCRHCSKRFVWSWSPKGRPWFCGDSCRRAAAKASVRERNKWYREMSA